MTRKFTNTIAVLAALALTVTLMTQAIVVPAAGNAIALTTIA